VGESVLSDIDPAALAAALCHEVGNHLAAIRMTTHMVTRGDPPSPAIASVEAASISAGRLVSQVRVLLRPPPPASKPASVERVLRDVRLELGDRLDGPIDFSFGPAHDLPDIGFSARCLSRQVAHLLLDAAERMTAGGVRLTLSAEEGGPSSDLRTGVSFVVEDDGPLLDSELGATTTPSRGRGLAVQAVGVIVGRGGGRVTVGVSEVGNRVALWLPGVTR
jgi:hypothetical protein